LETSALCYQRQDAGGAGSAARGGQLACGQAKTVLRQDSGDIQDPPGQGPLQPAVGGPASAGELD